MARLQRLQARYGATCESDIRSESDIRREKDRRRDISVREKQYLALYIAFVSVAPCLLAFLALSNGQLKHPYNRDANGDANAM